MQNTFIENLSDLLANDAASGAAAMLSTISLVAAIFVLYYGSF